MTGAKRFEEEVFQAVRVLLRGPESTASANFLPSLTHPKASETRRTLSVHLVKQCAKARANLLLALRGPRPPEILLSEGAAV